MPLCPPVYALCLIYKIDLTVSLPLENLEEEITTEIQGTPGLGRFWDSHFTDAHTGEGTYPRLHT